MSALSLCALLAVMVVASGAYQAPDNRQPAPHYRARTTRAPHYRPRPTSAPHYRPRPTSAPHYRPRPTSAPHYRPRPTSAPHYRPRAAPGHTVVDACTCFEKGNYYSPVSSDDCRSFTQRTAFLPEQTQRCPYGTQFDVKTCVCNHAAATVCPRYCQKAYHAPATSYRTCSQNGNIYAQVPNTNCYAFTQATATLPPQKHYCPAGLQFDLHTCVCNYPKDTRCYV